MPAKSKAQQRFMGMVHSYNKGDMKDAPTSVKKAAKGMTKKSAKDFASTKHKGKPEHVDESLRRLIRQEIQNALKEASNFRDKTDAYTNAMTSLDRYFLNMAAIPAPKKAKKVSKLINTLRKTYFSKDEAKSINVEPNWEGLYRFMMHMKKGDNAAYVQVTRKMGADWKKIVAMAEKNKWKKESVKEARLVGYDKSYLDNAKKRLKVPHEITNIEYKQTRYRGPHDKFVRIWFKLKWKPGIRFDPEEKWVSVFYDSPERLKMIGKTLKLKLKESVNEATSSKDFFSGSKVTNSLPRATLNQLNGKLNKASETIIKITDKYKKQGDIDGLVKIWMRGLHLSLKRSGIKIESVNERVSSPFSQHLKDAQEEVEYMISEHPEAAEEGVYDKPKQAIKFLQVAQKALGKIT